MNLKSYLHQRQNWVNRALNKYLPLPKSVKGSVHEAMRYSVLGDGKRIRPVLALASCEAAGGKVDQAIHAACALELVHAYSLVHDDLPAMDDDDLRRGKPSCHKKYGEAIGILTGDALLTFAFELLTRSKAKPAVQVRVIREIAQAIGTEGMVGGQVADIFFMSQGRTVDAKTMDYINRRKTGALLSASVRVGALLGGANTAAYRRFSLYGENVGLVFQLIDDILDKDGAVRGSSVEAVRRRAEKLTDEAIAALKPFGKRAEPLRQLAQFLVTRGS
jgi:geranylgeranyl diphosphate synthase type II